MANHSTDATFNKVRTTPLPPVEESKDFVSLFVDEFQS